MKQEEFKFKEISKLFPGDVVAILSPSFAAPGKWPHVYELGKQRLKDEFGLQVVDYESTTSLRATYAAKANDLISAFTDPRVKAVIASIGGDDQIKWVKDLPQAPFANNPKPFFGFSDNTNIINHLWSCRVPSYYGGALFTEFAMPHSMDDFTKLYLKKALFEGGVTELHSSSEFSEVGLNWDDEGNLNKKRSYESNQGWFWDGEVDVEGITWGGCLESIVDLIKAGGRLPSLEEFSGIVLYLETSDEIPDSNYVKQAFDLMGERGVLQRVQAVLLGRPKSWEFNRPYGSKERIAHKESQRATVVDRVRAYNLEAPIVQNLDFGHTSPQICFPSGRLAKIGSSNRKIMVEF